MEENEPHFQYPGTHRSKMKLERPDNVILKASVNDNKNPRVTELCQ